MHLFKLIPALCALAPAWIGAAEPENVGIEESTQTTAPEQAQTHEISPVRFVVYALQPNQPLFVAASEGELQPLPTYSGMVSPPVEMLPPIRFSHRTDVDTFAEWTPEDAEARENWILLLAKDPEDRNRPTIHPIPVDYKMFEQSTVLVANLSEFELSGISGGTELVLAPAGHQLIEMKSGKLAIDLRSTTTPHRSLASFNDLERTSRYLLILTAPYLKNSANLGHRLVQIPVP
ncbi:MAG: hypothetical protein ACLFU4_03250 [Opitutales bacterium]